MIDIEGHPDDHSRDVDGVQQNHPGFEDEFEGDNENPIDGFKIAFSGFIDIMHNKKKLPWGSVLNTIYLLGLCVYFLINLIYSIVTTSVQRDQFPYHFVYMSISLIGFAVELLVIIFTIRKCLTGNDDDENDNYHEADEQAQPYYCHVLVDYVILSIGEFLIYPTLICVMYGFINERAWQFDNGISGCNFLLLIYSGIMDALYMKFYVIILTVRVLCGTYAKYNELAQNAEVKWKRSFIIHVWFSVMFTTGTALTNWLMTIIIGVRIYVDNFTPETNDNNSSIPDTGDYKAAIFTQYMIACAIFLPVLSWITYIIINKQWFYKVYSAISQLQFVNHAQLQEDKNRFEWDDKLADYFTNPLAYIVTVMLMVSFIAFTVGTYLPDYDSSEYEVVSSARYNIMGFCFIGVFLLSNFQAAIIFTVVVVMIVILILCGVIILLLCGLPILLCAVFYYRSRRRKEQFT